MGAFVRQRRGRQIVATFQIFEAQLIHNLAGQVVELLQDGRPAPVASDDPLAALFDFAEEVYEPEDPALLRLLPNAYRDDADAAADFRRFTESTLRDRKVATATTLLESLEAAGLTDHADDAAAQMIDVELTDEDALSWLTGLNDIRLALASRLGIAEGEEEFWQRLPEDDPRHPTYQIYQWLAYLQETLVAALSR